MRKRYQKDSLANMKNSGEIHEQLVTYDEEGGGEMDTNGYADEKTLRRTLLNWQSEYNWNELTWLIRSPPPLFFADLHFNSFYLQTSQRKDFQLLDKTT